MGSQDITTIVGNSSGEQSGINLDSTRPYSKREYDDVKIDINKVPDFDYGDVSGLQFEDCQSEDDLGNNEDDDEEEESENEEEEEEENENKEESENKEENNEEESESEKIPIKKIKKEEPPLPITKPIILKPHNIRSENAKILLEFFFLSLPEEKWENPRFKDVFKEEYILDLKPRLLSGSWDCDDFEMEVSDLMHSGKIRTFDFDQEDFIEQGGGFDNSLPVQINEYSLICNRGNYDVYLNPPREREGEKLFIVTRTYHYHCYFPFIREEFPKDILSEEQLVWVSHELGIDDKSLSRLELWKKTKKALNNKCYKDEVFVIPDNVKTLLLCANELEPDNPAFGKNNMPKDILKLILLNGDNVRNNYLSEVREIERMILEEEKEKRALLDRRRKERASMGLLLPPWF